MTLPYKQRAVIATVATETHNQTAWQRFLPTGPLALLPMGTGPHGAHYSNVVWSTTPDHASELRQLSPHAFSDAVNESFTKSFPAFSWDSQPARPSLRGIRGPFGPLKSLLDGPGGPGIAPLTIPTTLPAPPAAIHAASPILSFPLALRYCGRYTRPGLALIGDAAHSVHPLAGQGANLGFADAAALVDSIADALRTGGDLAEVSATVLHCTAHVLRTSVAPVLR